MNVDNRLLQMLAYRRPAGSEAERKFIRRFLRPLGVKQDPAGNLILRIGDAPVMWSCHTDTVHHSGGKQTLAIDRDGFITAPGSSCLGADDTAGIWLMVNMIERGVPGLYIFHRAEECGGLGSEYIATNNQELLAGINYAIALDRKGTTSIVTEQGFGRCCSDAFANALAAGLGLPMRPDPTGTFTDTANYMALVPECTNISVGYCGQHTSTECLNAPFLNQLLEALCSLDVESLPVQRTPCPNGDDYLTAGDAGEQDIDFQSDGWNPRGLDGYEALRDVIRYHPDTVADFLEGYGITAEEIMDHSGVRSSYRRVA